MSVRRLAIDGDLAVEEHCRPLFTLTLAESMVLEEEGDVRMTKRDRSQRHRDDLASALVLAAGVLARAPKPSRTRIAVAG